MMYTEQLAALAAVDAELGSQVLGLRNLEAILKWAPSVGISLASIDLDQQDAYSYDLYLHLPDSRWIVFGVS